MPAKAASHKATPRKSSKTAPRTWSAKVTLGSDALTLENAVFAKTPRGIALSLKRPAERTRRRKGTPFQSAMSMLNFYINRAGKNLSQAKRRQLDAAKNELRRLFHRETAP